MDHIRLSISVLNLIIGGTAVFYAFQMKTTTRFSVLRPYAEFIIYFNLYILADSASRYLFINVQNGASALKDSVYVKILKPFDSIWLFLLAYALVRIVFLFQEKQVPQRLKKWFFLSLGICILLYGLRILFSLQNIRLFLLGFIYISIGFAAVFLSCGLMLYLLIYANRIHDKKRAVVIRSFGLFYSLAFMFFVISVMLHEPVKTIFGSCLLLSFNLFPFFWFKRVILKYLYAVPVELDRKLLDGILSQYDISTREIEIIEFMMHGKSNKEIASALFISRHTVKNHIYRIYKKLNVSSRIQLIQFVMKKT
jgi:DNA-binding CsgD family transcriptional regulator